MSLYEYDYYKEPNTMTIKDYRDYCIMSATMGLPILNRHNNMHYEIAIGESKIVFIYSYQTRVGLLDGNRKMLIEWAHNEHYSVTTSKQMTILSNELKIVAPFYTIKRVSLEEAMKMYKE